MPNSFRVNITGGIDAVGDLALGDGKHVAYMENLDVRGGKAMPFNLPLVNPNVAVPTDAVQVYAYRSRLYFSPKRRDYAAEFIQSRERVYWTEYGGHPMKFIGASQDDVGATVPLGTAAPLAPPGVAIGSHVSPNNIQAITTDGGGQLASGTSVSFRLAYQTAYGVLPPSGSIQAVVTTDSSLITVVWDNPTILDVQITGVQVFVGITGGDEVYFTTLLPDVTQFMYSGNTSGSGAPATAYDQSLSYQYCTTYTRNVMGVVDESGPSSPSPLFQSSSSRLLTFDPSVEGLLSSPNLVTWGSPFRMTQIGSGTPGYGVGNALTVSSIVSDPDTGNIVCTFSTNHYYYNGQRIIIAGCSPDPFGGEPIPIEVLAPSITDLTPAPMLNYCLLSVAAGFTAPGAGLTGVTAYAVPSVQIESMSYLPQGGSIAVQTVTPNTFGVESVWFSGMYDEGWNNQLIPVLPDPTNDYQFFVDSKAMPALVLGASGLSFNAIGGTATASLAVNLINLLGATGTTPIIGDILYFDTTLTGPTGSTSSVQGAFPVLATPSGSLLINTFANGMTGASGGTGPAGGFQFIPFNDYLQYRNVYRAGGTENFQLCQKLPLNVLSALDVIPDQGLGVVLPTLYTENGVDVVVAPAPFGLVGLIQHYGMGFAWDPASNNVRWTITGNMDAWPAEFFYDGIPNRILGLADFDQACCVFCEDGVYRGDGTDPTNLLWHKTKASPCRAGGSIQFLKNRIIYLSDEGLTSFDGQNSQSLTDLKIPADFWLANSAYLAGSNPGSYLVPPLQNAAYERLRGIDLPAVSPPSTMPYLVSRTTQRQGIRSFVKYGRYYLYWGGDFSEFAAQTMIMVDFSSPGSPIVSIGVKAQDAFVDELERVHMLLISPTE